MAVKNSLVRLSRENCIREFGQPFQSSNNLLLLVLSLATKKKPQTTSILKEFSARPPDNNPGFFQRECPADADTLKWLCKSVNTNDCSTFCISMIPQLLSNETWAPFDKEVDYCLVNRAEEQCTLNFSLHIMIIVIIMNACKVVILCVVGIFFISDPLLTLGDAVGSFLTVPDVSIPPANLRIDNKKRHTRLSRRVAVSRSRWVLCISV